MRGRNLRVLWFVYNVLFMIGYTLMLPRFLFRMWKRGGYKRGFLQRFGIYSTDIRERLIRVRPVWIHAVSVGEVLVALKFMERLRAREKTLAFVLTTTTSTGYRIASERLTGHADLLLYFPSDFPVVVGRVLGILRPRMLLLTECELWPNLIRKAKSLGVPIALINGRISLSSFEGYRRLGIFVRPILRLMDLLLVQTETDRKRLEALGAPADTIHVMNSAKYDVADSDPVAAEKISMMLERVGILKSDPVIVGGSTWPGEEDVLCTIYRDLKKAFPSLRLILVPRHAERRAEVEKGMKEQGLEWTRRSELESARGPVDVVLVDTTGELMSFYARASVVFVGKSLKSHGGQNLIEPALLGKPVVVGPNMENFPVVLSEFLEEGAVLQVKDEHELAESLGRLLANESLREMYGRKAREAVQRRRGSIEKSVDRVLGLLSASLH